MWRIVPSIILVALSCTAFAQRDARTAALDTNPGLDKPITISLRAASIREVLDEVEAETGVRLRPEREIAEDKATIYAKEKPAREVLRALAHCFNLCWTDSEIGRFRFLHLFTDRDSNAELRRRHYEDYLAITNQFDQEIQTTVQYIRSEQEYEPPQNIGSLSGDDYDRLRRRQYGTRSLAYGAMALQYLNLSELQRKDLMAGKHVVVTGAAITKEAQDRMPNVASIDFWIDRSLGGYLLRCSIQPFVPTSLMLATAIFDDSRYDKVVQSANVKLLEDPALDKEPPAPKPDEKPSTPPAAATQPTQSTSAETEPAVRPYVPPPGVPNPGEGSGATPTTMSDGLLPIVQAADIPIVAQYISEYGPFAPTARTGDKVRSPKKTGEQLAELCSRHRFTIERDGDFLLAKSLLWHRLRDREVPEKNIKRWQPMITGLPSPTFEATVEMGNVSWEQIRGIIANSRYWFGIPNPSELARCEYVLRFYASLTPNQKRALNEGTAMAIAALKPNQQHLFMQACELVEQPTYEYAKDENWAQRATFSLRDLGVSGRTLFAVANMRRLGEHVLPPVPEGEIPFSPDEMTPEQAYYAMRDLMGRKMEEQVPEAARVLAGRVAAEHPEIPPKSIVVYVEHEVAFELQLEGTIKIRTLTYSERVTR